LQEARCAPTRDSIKLGMDYGAISTALTAVGGCLDRVPGRVALCPCAAERPRCSLGRGSGPGIRVPDERRSGAVPDARLDRPPLSDASWNGSRWLSAIPRRLFDGWNVRSSRGGLLCASLEPRRS